MVIVVIISFITIAYLIYRLKTSKENESMERDNSQNIYENPTNTDENYVVQEENEQSTYTALNRSGKDENNDHVYCHLNKVPKRNLDYVNQEETGM